MIQCANVREQQVLQVYAVKPDCEQSRELGMLMCQCANVPMC